MENDTQKQDGDSDGNGSPLLPYAAILAAVILWGCSFAGMRVALASFSPWIVMWIRMLTALIVLLPFSRRLIPSDYRKGDWRYLVPMILCQPCLYFALEVKALTLTSSSQAGLISATVPLLTSIAAWFTLKEKLGPRFVAGLVVSLIGVVWLTLGNAPRFDGGNPVLGNALEFGAMIADTVSMIIVKKLSSRYNPFTLTAMQVLGGLVFFLPGVWGIAHTPIRAWSADLLLIIMGLGAFVTLGAFGLYNWGMSRITASRASAFIYLTPVTAVIVGWFFLNETLTTGQCMAACVVIAGVMLSESFPRGKKAGR